MDKTDKPRVIISAILEKIVNGEHKVFFQTRWKPKASPTYLGLLEIPAGGIDSYEDVYEAVKREVYEETGLRVTKFINDFQGKITENRPRDRAKVFQPFICQQVLETNGGLPWIGFVFRCEVEGEIKMELTEAKDPQWLSVIEIKEIIKNKPNNIFPLQFPVIEYYLEFLDKESTASV